MINYEKCSGCGFCSAICPKSAISLKENKYGFLYPIINKDLCIECKLCETQCPTNFIQTECTNDAFIARNPNQEERMKSSSGGIFAKLANYVISKGGVVFGAEFDNKFNVIIKYTENDISKMMRSKYVASDVKNTFKECKDFLEAGRTVLYSGLPCQIYGLKRYLKNDYENLITVDIFCHGVPSNSVWHKYLDSFDKEIESIDFRDKCESWKRFHFTIKFKDGTVLSEYHRDNKYMNLFLDNKILRKSCFSCEFRNHQVSDISIGDAWGTSSKLNDNKGTSIILVHTKNGANVLSSIPNIELEKANQQFANKAFNIKWSVPEDRKNILEYYAEPKVAMITIPGHENVGNTLQAFALQSKIKEILPNSKPYIINQKDKDHLLNFYKKNVKYTDEKFNSTYNILIVGSDQIWIPYVWPGVPFEDQFLIRTCQKRIVYGASFGKHTVKFSDLQKQKIHNSLKTVKYIGTREISGTWLTKKLFDINNAVPVLDPTMLYDKNFYLKAVNSEASENKKGIFMYVLDKSNEWYNLCNKLSKELNEPILPYDGSVESFIQNMESAKCVITDSYHGSVFSIIFNKPFITLRNMKRGNDRFDDLSIRFNIDNRFVTSLNFDIKLLSLSPNIDLEKKRFESIKFLKKALKEF